MTRTRSLPIVLTHTAGQRFDCHACTTCCRELVVRLLPADRERIDARNWAQTLGVAPYVKLRGEWVLNKRADGRCVFLEESGACRLHREHGLREKPLACQLFPFRIVPAAERWRIAWRFDCPTIARSQGRLVEEHESEVTRLAGQASAATLDLPAGVGLPAGPEQAAADALIHAADRWLRRSETPLDRKLAGLGSIATVLADPSFSTTSGDDLARLIRSIGEGLAESGPNELPPSTPRQRAMLRVAAFAHCEHVSLAEARSAVRRLSKRFGQLSRARRFRRARGTVPPLPGGARPVPFAQVEAVRPAGEDGPAIDELLSRYLRVILDSHSFYGPAYYGWPLREGFAALVLRTGVMGWLARYYAASAGRDQLRFDDAVAAVGRVDQSAGRLKSLGSPAERLRLKYLLRDQGLLRLLRAYPLTGDR